MIVRVSTEGQYELRDDALGRLHELDDACQDAVEDGDGEQAAPAAEEAGQAAPEEPAA